YGIPMFLDQLVEALRLRRASGGTDNSEIDRAAAKHGQSLHQRGFTIAQVVHDYGDVCQVVTDLALDRDAQPVGTEFQTLNLCLDDAIASAVTQFAEQNVRTLRAVGN